MQDTNLVGRAVVAASIERGAGDWLTESIDRVTIFGSLLIVVGTTFWPPDKPD